MLAGLLLIAAPHVVAADQVAQGRAIYLEHCASCHGLAADGNGPMARVLDSAHQSTPALGALR